MNVYIETGAYVGDTLYNAEYPLKYSIEYDYNLYLYCKNRFIGDDNITMIHGDSRTVLEDLLVSMGGQSVVVIFLDASTRTTSVLIDELELIMKHPGNYKIRFNKSNIGKMGKNGIITLECILELVRQSYRLVVEPPDSEIVELIQNSGSESSVSECSSSDSL